MVDVQALTDIERIQAMRENNIRKVYAYSEVFLDMRLYIY